MKLALTTLLLAAALRAQPPDTILIHGKILTVDPADSILQALAIRNGRITAVGPTTQIQAQAGPSTRVIDLGGRTVIPGLIDSHMHAIRAALSFATEVNWIGARSLPEALDRIRAAARAKPPGTWLIVAGGWTPDQFKERRRPTQAELESAAPDHPVYVQQGYGWAMLTPAAYRTLHIAAESDLPAGGRFEQDSQGNPTGAVTGAIIPLFDLLPKPTLAQQVEGTRLFFRELNRLGITGVVDPGGNNLFPPDYQAVQQVWREGGMTVRVAYALNGQTDGREFEEFQDLTQLLPMRFGDDFLRFNGLGERITLAMNNNNDPSPEVTEKYYQILRWAAGRGMAITMHWASNASVGKLLDIFESVNQEVPIAGLRWSIAHLNDASEATLRRMQALGVGWTMQDATYFSARPGAANSNEAPNPPINTAIRLGVHVGAGTDAHRVMSYNPFTCLQWMLDGKTVTGVPTRTADQIPTRAAALRLYTMGSAWFSFDEAERGSLEVGKLADLAVLSKDYLTVPVEEIGGIESLLTMVGGKVVYTAAPF